MREVLLIFYTSASSFVHSQHWLIYDNQDNSIASFHTKYQISKYKKFSIDIRFTISVALKKVLGKNIKYQNKLKKKLKIIDFRPRSYEFFGAHSDRQVS